MGKKSIDLPLAPDLLPFLLDQMPDTGEWVTMGKLIAAVLQSGAVTTAEAVDSYRRHAKWQHSGFTSGASLDEMESSGRDAIVRDRLNYGIKKGLVERGEGKGYLKLYRKAAASLQANNSKMLIPLHAIRTDGGTQTRPALIEESVQGCMDRMRATDDLPPVEVVQEGDIYWLWDGFHREESHRRLDRHTIMANVRKGTLDDARWLAASANKASDPHIVGNQRNEATKRACVLLALRQRPNLSDGVIAKHVGCSTRYVGMVRAEATVNTSQLPDQPRLGRDGKTRKTKPATFQDQVQNLHGKGHGTMEIARKLNVPHPRVSREKKRLGLKSERETERVSNSEMTDPRPLGLDQEVEERIAAVLDRINRAVGDLLDEPKRRELVAFIERLVRS